MNRALLNRLQKVNNRTNLNKKELSREFFSGLKNKLKARGYRADLKLTTDARSTKGKFKAHVKFDPKLGNPDETDLLSLVAQDYPKHQVDWELAQIDPDNGIVVMVLEPSMEVIPVSSMSAIPPEFRPIGTALYKRAADASGTVNEIWTLKKDNDGLMCLFRNPEDIEVQAEDSDSFKANDVVDTPYGYGRIVRFDDAGNAFVQLGHDTRLVAKDDMKPYKKRKEEAKLADMFEMMYGDRDFAKALVQDYGRKDAK